MTAVLDIGVDVAKAELVIAVCGRPDLSTAIPNTERAVKEWIGTVPIGSRIGAESTGPYHELLALAGEKAGMNVFVLNARDVFYYARALGQRGKTDRTDAEVIARYIAEHHGHLHTFEAGTHAQRRIDSLLRRRAAVAGQKSALKQTLRGVPELSEEVAVLQKQYDVLLAALDQQLLSLVQEDTATSVTFSLLKTIPGFGPQNAAMFASVLKRIPFKNSDALVAFSGLDPRPADSGQRRGRRRLSKRGPSLMRRLIYLAASASSRTKAGRPIYAALRARGFSTTAALVILSRKLLRTAFAVCKSGKPFDIEQFSTANVC